MPRTPSDASISCASGSTFICRLIPGVLSTIIHPDLETLLSLGTVVLIRTLISVTLNWELALAKKTGSPTAYGGKP